MTQAKNKSKLLVMKDKVSKEAVAATPVVDATDGTTLAAPTKSIPFYDENGDIVGYMALWANATLLV